jgi:hypothetical protein
MIAALILSAALAPEPPPPPPGVLPWPVPEMPTVDVDETYVPETSWIDPVHSDDYEDMEEDTNDKIDKVVGPLSYLVDLLDDFIGIGGLLADTTTLDDIDTELDPVDAGATTITAFEFVDDAGEAVGTLFAIARTWLRANNSPPFQLAQLLLVSAVWMLFVNIMIIGLKVMFPILRWLSRVVLAFRIGGLFLGG